MVDIQNFLSELGTGFVFAGRAYRLEVGQTEQFLDMHYFTFKDHFRHRITIGTA